MFVRFKKLVKLHDRLMVDPPHDLHLYNPISTFHVSMRAVAKHTFENVCPLLC